MYKCDLTAWTLNIQPGALKVACAKKRRLAEFLQKAEELDPQEEEGKKDLDPDLATIISRKRTLLLDHMAHSVGHPDLTVGQMLREGARVTGWQVDSGAFGKRLVAPTLTVKDLLAASELIRQETVASVSRGSDPEITRKVWDSTVEEETKGWLKLLPVGEEPLKER